MHPVGTHQLESRHSESHHESETTVKQRGDSVKNTRSKSLELKRDSRYGPTAPHIMERWSYPLESLLGNDTRLKLVVTQN